MHSASVNSNEYHIDDVPAASIRGTRLNAILMNIDAGRSLSTSQREFLAELGLHALLALSRRDIDKSDFETAASAEQRARLAARADARDAAEASVRLRHNADLFAEIERRRAQRKLLDDFGVRDVKLEVLHRVCDILRQVADGFAIGADDLAWLVGDGRPYFTPKLRRAHHRILAETDAKAWRETGDPWNAVNACANFRSATAAFEGLAIADAALSRTTAARPRSALLTTSGGALRDLGRRVEAIARGDDAHALSPNDYRPCTLLGALHIELSAYVEGAAWFEKAEARGASRRQVDREIAQILRSVCPEEREKIRRALSAHDAARFAPLRELP